MIKFVRKRLFGKKAEKDSRTPLLDAPDTTARTSTRSSETETTTQTYGSTSDSATIVCDLGSAWTRIGLASSPLPTVQLRSLVGRLKPDSSWPNKSHFVLGEDIEPTRPIYNGEVVDEAKSAFLLAAGCRRLGVLSDSVEDLSGRNLLVALRPDDPYCDNFKEEFFETLMETYNPDGCHFAIQQALVPYAAQTSPFTGLVLDSGLEVTHAVPVYGGQVVGKAIVRTEVGGDDVTDRLLAHVGQMYLYDYRVRSMRDVEVLERMKKALALVSPYPGRAPPDLEAGVFERPGCEDIILKVQRYLCTEPLFNPDVMGENDSSWGIADAVTEALKKCEPFMLDELAANVLTIGGNSGLSGFDRRLQAELDREYAGRAWVSGSDARLTAVWSGAAAFARTQKFQDAVVTRDEYFEKGLTAFEEKCF